MRRNLRLLKLCLLRLTARLTAGLGLRAQTPQGTSSLDPYFKNLTMVKFLVCLKMPTLRTVELRFRGGFLFTKLNHGQDNPAPSFIYHSRSGYYTAVLTAFLLLPTLFQKT